MDWIKIPTDSILYSEFKDSELIALIKYQALYCQLESQPTTEQMKRILNRKQLQFVQSYSEVVQELCKNQVQIIKQKRNRDKENYKQKQCITKNSAVGKLSERKLVSVADKIREDKNNNIPPIIPLTGDDSGMNPVVNDSDLQDIKNFEEWRAQQAGYKKDYEPVTELKPQDKPIKSYAYCGHVIRLNDKDFKAWKKRYSNLDLEKELSGLDDYYYAHNVDDWFFRVQKELDKRNNHG